MCHQSTHPPQPAAEASISSLQLPQQAPSSSNPGSCSSALAGEASHGAAAAAPCLFAFPLESNFSGARYDPAVVRQIQTSGLAVTPCACSKGSEQQCSPQSGVHRTSEEEQQCHQQQATKEQHCGWQQRQSAEEEPQPNHHHQQEQQQQTKEEQQQSVQQLQAAAEEEKYQYPGQHSKEEAARLRVGESGCSEGDRWHVLIDAAKACATAPTDLTQNPADFVVSQCHLYFVVLFFLLAGHPISS